MNTTRIDHWQVRSSADVADPGDAISTPGYATEEWLVAPARSTAMAALLANGHYPDVFFSTNLRDVVDPALFAVPWWYRAEFSASREGRTLIRTDGVIHKAELWVNGTRVAGADEIAGAYPVHTFDVSGIAVEGMNALALLVFPGNPMTDLSVGWIDWNPMPPDANMGVWRDVVVLRTGAVRLADPHVLSDLSDAHDRAELRVAVDVENAASDERVVTIDGTVVAHDRDGEGRRFSRAVRLSAGERRRVVFTAAETPALAIEQPRVWWPVGYGDHPLYQLRLEASVDGTVSDSCATDFGIRQVTSRLEPGGGRRFIVNGRAIPVRGAGWCPDIFLRYDRQRLVDELAYVVELGLNAVRLEGKLENPEFYEIANELGIMVLPGWECCNKWESHAGTGGSPWSEQDFLIARRSMASEARLLRNHPCVVSFQIGSDFAPPEPLAEIYVNELKAAQWSLPIVSSGASKWNNPSPDRPDDDTTSTAVAGLSGMKMWPYDWVPPVYWYGNRYGGAVGFSSESSAGHSIPRLPSLRAMLADDEIERLWREPEARQFHAAPPSVFDNIAHFHRALTARYGEPTSLEDFSRKAQLANYEMVRAQFEAYGGRFDAPEPATGLIYWMLNTAWPSLNWHLYDYFLDPAGAYFGARKANEPLHIQYDYGTGEVVVVRRGSAPLAESLVADIVIRDVDGVVRSARQVPVEAIADDASRIVGRVEVPDDMTTTYFVELLLSDAEQAAHAAAARSRNVYWLSTKPDVPDWDKSSWQHTPQAAFADFTGLERLAPAFLEASTEVAQGEVSVTLRNASGVPAVGVHVSLVTADGARPIAPVHWDDNDVTLFGGQVSTLTARYSPSRFGGTPRVLIDGFNVAGTAGV